MVVFETLCCNKNLLNRCATFAGIELRSARKADNGFDQLPRFVTTSAMTLRSLSFVFRSPCFSFIQLSDGTRLLQQLH